MSNNAYRFQSMNTKRTGALAYQGIMAQVQAELAAEREAQAQQAALDAEIDQLVYDTFYSDRIASVDMGECRKNCDIQRGVVVHRLVRVAPNYVKVDFTYVL